MRPRPPGLGKRKGVVGGEERPRGDGFRWVPCEEIDL